jgi:hypothetical protein
MTHCFGASRVASDQSLALSEDLVDPLILLGFQETWIQAARSVECG